MNSLRSPFALWNMALTALMRSTIWCGFITYTCQPACRIIAWSVWPTAELVFRAAPLGSGWTTPFCAGYRRTNSSIISNVLLFGRTISADTWHCSPAFWATTAHIGFTLKSMPTSSGRPGISGTFVTFESREECVVDATLLKLERGLEFLPVQPGIHA